MERRRAGAALTGVAGCYPDSVAVMVCVVLIGRRDGGELMALPVRAACRGRRGGQISG
jgi:hypothetical protein